MKTLVKQVLLFIITTHFIACTFVELHVETQQTSRVGTSLDESNQKVNDADDGISQDSERMQMDSTNKSAGIKIPLTEKK